MIRARPIGGEKNLNSSLQTLRFRYEIAFCFLAEVEVRRLRSEIVLPFPTQVYV